MGEPKVLYGPDGMKVVITAPSEVDRLQGEGYTTEPEATELTEPTGGSESDDPTGAGELTDQGEEATESEATEPSEVEIDEVLKPDGSTDSGTAASKRSRRGNSKSTRSSDK